MNIQTLPRETIEFLPITIMVDGVKVTNGVSLSSVIAPQRPIVWSPATLVGTNIGLIVSAPAPGLYTVYAKIAGTGETPVILCGQYLVN